MVNQMRIGIITFHFPYNCGATLQCAALQTCLEKMNQDVCVINYRPWYHQNRYIPLKNPFYYAFKCMRKRRGSDKILRRLARGVYGFIQVVYSWRHYRNTAAQHRRFETFIENNLRQTRVYRTLKRLQVSPPPCDLYISGSDQLWNAHLTEGEFDPAYFLDFGSKETVRVSYAVGTNFDGMEQISESLTGLLSRLDAISLRETKFQDAIRSAAPNTPIHIDLDPTFLLEARDYEPMICQRPLESEPFILTYTMPDDSQHKVYNAAKIFGEKMKMKVIDVSGNPSKVNAKIADHRICGPDEFLWYIKNASYVMTNSFHGTAFSVNFRKQFIVIPHMKTGNRVEELLDKMKLSSRVKRTGTDAAKAIAEPIDYTETDQQLAQLRKESIHYLQECLSISKGKLG